MIIDIHAHYLPQLLYDRFGAEAAKFPGVQLLRGDKGMRLRFPGGANDQGRIPADIPGRRIDLEKGDAHGNPVCSECRQSTARAV